MSTQPSTDHSMDMKKARAFTQKVVGDLSGTMATVMCIIGDRLGIFKDLAANGPATSQELADRVNVNERYVREWLTGMGYAGYLEYGSTDGRFALPAEHATVVAQEEAGSVCQNSEPWHMPSPNRRHEINQAITRDNF